MDVDVAVIGGGAVGLAVAMELAPRGRVAAIERHAAPGIENSSHNSGVIHAGIYYPAGSLKHTLCIEGNALLYAWAETHGLRARRIGKLIIAVDKRELDALAEVAAQARANSVPGMSHISDAKTLREVEPAVRCVAALFSASTGVIDQAAFVRSLAAEFEARGGWLALRHELTSAQRHGAGFRLHVRGPDGATSVIDAAALVNSGGLGAPAVASMLGYPLDGSSTTPPIRHHVNKGRYYDIITPAKARALNHLVYPVPDHARGGLGVHVTIDIDGGAHLGPDTEWLDEGMPLDYRADDLRRADFAAAASRYLPSISADDLAPGQVGYRPKLQAPGGAFADFLVWRDRGYLHLGGIESPGLTASLALARHVATLL